MGDCGWQMTDKYDLWERRRGESYLLWLRLIGDDRINLTPDEAMIMGEALISWGEKEKESGRPILK